MFGLKGSYVYLDCRRCSSLSLTNPPPDYSPFYPNNYYSFSLPASDVPTEPHGLVRRFIWRKRNEAQILARGGFWGLIARIRPRPDLEPVRRHFRGTTVFRSGYRLLDVGCGNAAWLRSLASYGLRGLHGVEPFARNANQSSTPLQIHHCRVHDLPRDLSFDLVLLSHSLEHDPEPRQVIGAIGKRLVPGGSCVVRIPIAGNAIWRRHRSLWVELDAPRHIAIPSKHALVQVAGESGLTLQSLEWEETEFGFWATELYRKGLSLIDPATEQVRRPPDYFLAQELEAFRSEARRLNRAGEGGRARFVFAKTGSRRR